MPWNNTNNSCLHTTVVTLGAGSFVQVAHMHCHLIYQFITSPPLLHFSSRHLPMAGKQSCPHHMGGTSKVKHLSSVTQKGCEGTENSTWLCRSWASLVSQSWANPLPIHISTSRNASLANKKTHLLPAKSSRLNSQLLFILFCFQHWRQRGERKEKKYIKERATIISFINLFPIHYNVLSWAKISRK